MGPTELSVPDQADVIVLKRRPGPSLRPGDLAAGRRPLRAPGPEDPAVPVGTQVATYTGWQSYATTTIAPTDVADRRLGGPLEWAVVNEFKGLDSAPEALASVFERGSDHIGRRVVRIADG
jgi:hypothetical protein